MESNATPMVAPSKGVQFQTPPASILVAALQMVNEGIAQLEPHERGAIVTIVTPNGVNGAIVSRAGEHVELVGWIGKDWGTEVTGGGAIKIRW